MRIVVQRVSQAAVETEREIIGRIGRGLLILVGIGPEDSEADIEYMADKILNLRVFSDEQGKMNLSVRDVNGSILAVSQFTLYGDCRKGRRPGYSRAAEPAKALDFYQKFVRQLSESGLQVEQGKFQADMQVSLINDGPVTLLLDSEKLF